MRATHCPGLDRRFVTALAATLGVLAAATTPAHAQCNSTYTTAGDFDGGTKLNTVTNGDQLELAVTTQPLPFVNIACSGRGTLVRIDVNSGLVIGEYFTAPGGMGRDPSRTTVDRLGNVWDSNRAETGLSQGVSKGSVTRVGIVIGGTRGTVDALGNFTPYPLGEYLQPPFQYSTCIDRDGDGLIRTSRGLANILAWSNAGNADADADGGVSTADDEALINYKLSSLPMTFEDVARPYYGVAGGCHALGAEGRLDAVVESPNWMMRRAFALDRLAPRSLVGVRLIGRLLDGTTFDLTDVIRVQ